MIATNQESSYARRCDDGLELRIKVVPGAARSEIIGPLGDRLKIRIAAPPEHGKANQALLLLVSQWLGIKDVQLIAGHSSSMKTLRIRGIVDLIDLPLPR